MGLEEARRTMHKSSTGGRKEGPEGRREEKRERERKESRGREQGR